MGITYSAPNGTRITSPAMTEVLPNQSQQTGNNTVVVSDTLGNIGGGQIGNGTNGVGDTYAGRLLIINQNTGTEQIRLCISDTAGTGTTRILTVGEDWDTNPVITTDTIYVPYEFGDIEDGGAGNGINLNSKSGLWEFSNTLEVLSTGVLQGLNGQGMELDDQGTTYAFQVQSGGFFYGGYPNSGASISGIQITSYNNAAGEASTEVLSGGHLHLWDTLIWGQLFAQTFDVQNGGEGYFRRCKWLSVTQELILYDSDIGDCSASGRGGTAEVVRVDTGTVIAGFVLSNIDTLDSRADTVTETLTFNGVQFVGVTDYINVRNNKTWDMIDPIWDVTIYTQFVWVGSTANRVNDRRSVNAVVQEADGTKLQNALVNIYENTQLADLVLELTTDVNGIASDSFIFREHLTNSATNTYGGHSFQAGKWLYLPFVAAQASDEKFAGTIVLNPDNNIVQTTQATAKSAGSTVTWNEDTNSSDLFGFDTGSGTLAVGMILTFSGGATGTITESKDGDSVSGVLHLKDRNATAIGATDTFSRTGGTAGTFSGTCNAAVNAVQSFAIWIDAQLLAYQTLYDYLAAIQNETTLTADGELIWEWCRNDQAQPLFHTGSSFFTERSNAKGIMVVDGGAGDLDYVTDDAGGTWTPPATVTIEVTVLDDVTGLAIEFAHVFLVLTSDYTTVVLSAATNASGVASVSYAYTVDQDIEGWARNVDFVADDYRPENISGTIGSNGFSRTVRLTPTS